MNPEIASQPVVSFETPLEPSSATASNLQSATRRVLAAAAEGDLGALAVALAERETAIRESASAGAAASEQVAALREGEAILSLLSALRSRIDAECGRLTRFSATLANSGPSRQALVDLFG
jgi:hypothetical protein